VIEQRRRLLRRISLFLSLFLTLRVISHARNQVRSAEHFAAQRGPFGTGHAQEHSPHTIARGLGSMLI
jgi:hypothetical protein